MAISSWSSYFALVALTSGLAGQDERPQIDWMTDLAKAETVAAASKKPLLLVFR